MAQASWPSPNHNSRAVTDVEYEAVAARFSDDGVYGEPGDTAVVAAGVGLSVDVRSDVSASVRGHAWTSGTTAVNLTISSNASPWDRIDRVVLRLDRSTWDVTAAVREGTPGSGTPALVQDDGDTGVYELPLATVSVKASATSVTVTRTEMYVGTRIRPCTSSNRPAAPRSGEGAFETDTGRLILWTGSAWTVVYSDSGGIVVNSALSAWDITVDSVLEERGGNVHLRLGHFQRAAGTLANDSDSRLPVLIPAAYRHPTRVQYGIAYITGAQIGRFTIYAQNTDKPGQVWLTQKPAISKGDFVMPGSGISWVV